MVILAFAHGPGMGRIYLSNAIMGVGFGPCLLRDGPRWSLLRLCRPSQTGVASGMNANIRTIGGKASVAAVMASIVTSHLAPSGLPKGVRLHDRVRRDGRGTRAGCLRRSVDPVGAAAGRDRSSAGRSMLRMAMVAGGIVVGEQTGMRRVATARGRGDATPSRNYHRILDAARDVLGEFRRRRIHGGDRGPGRGGRRHRVPPVRQQGCADR